MVATRGLGTSGLLAPRRGLWVRSRNFQYRALGGWRSGALAQEAGRRGSPHLQKVAEASLGVLLEWSGNGRRDLQDSVLLGCSQLEHASALGDRVLVNPGQGVVPALTYMALFSFQPLSSM